MTYLVTGSAGHLGEALVRTLRAQGAAVRGIDIRASDCTDEVGSIVDREFVKRQMQGASVVFHAASLHKPHVATHSRQDFIDTNVSGTLNLLEATREAGVRIFVFTSTTSVFGDALRTKPGEPANWITEETAPVPKNIYGATKSAAEDLCQLAHRNDGLACIVLRTSRFFPEEDDSKAIRDGFCDENAKANEFCYRRAGLSDMVSAHLIAAECAPEIGFDRFIISAPPPFEREDGAELGRDAPSVLAKRVPEYAEIYARLGWRMFPTLDRVYSSRKALEILGWRPVSDFAAVLRQIDRGERVLGALADTIGAKGYHETKFKDGPYPVEPD